MISRDHKILMIIKLKNTINNENRFLKLIRKIILINKFIKLNDIVIGHSFNLTIIN